MPKLQAMLALGAIAHDAVLRPLGLRKRHCRFAHGALHALPGGLTLADSYHCSRYNTNTGRLTTAMFEAVVTEVAALVRQAVLARRRGHRLGSRQQQQRESPPPHEPRPQAHA